MGYLASANGAIQLRNMSEVEEKTLLSAFNRLNRLIEWNNAANIFQIMSPMGEDPDITKTETGYTLCLNANEIYHEDEMLDWLRMLAPYTVSGKIEYVGEDGALWRHRFTGTEWVEDAGHVVYENENNVLLIFHFETGDASCRYYTVPVGIEGTPDMASIEDSISAYIEQNAEAEDYDDIVKNVMDASGLKWQRTNPLFRYNSFWELFI